MSTTPTKLWRYLSSLWGTLSAVAILFPGAAALLKAGPAPQGSQLKAYYEILPSLLAAFALLLLTTFRDGLANAVNARKVGIWFFSLGVILLFGSLYTKLQFVDINELEPPRWAGSQVTTVERLKGAIAIKTIDTVSHTTVFAS